MACPDHHGAWADRETLDLLCAWKMQRRFTTNPWAKCFSRA
jgi:hypothetical protein